MATPSLESEDQNKEDPLFFLLKTLSNTSIGGKDNQGNPQLYFDEKDVGLIQSTALLQKLNGNEFKLGTQGSVNQSWLSFLRSGSKTYDVANTFATPSTFTISWSASGSFDNEISECRALEVSWSTAVIQQWGVVVGTKSGRGGSTSYTVGQSWNQFKTDLITHADSSISVMVDQDSVETYLEGVINGSNNHSMQPGSAGSSTIPIIEYFKFFNASTGEKFENPGEISDLNTLINSIYGNTESDQIDSIRNNLYNFKSVGASVQGFQNSTEYSVGPYVKGEDRVTGYKHNQTEEEIEFIPDGDDISNYTTLYGNFSILDEFKEQFSKYTDLGAPEHLFSGVMINNHLIENQSLINLIDTPTGYIGHSGDYLIVNTGESGIYFTGIEKIAQDLTDYGFIGGDGITGFTGLYDTPTGYESGYYLRSSDTGIEYISVADLTQEVSDGLGDIVGVGEFTGLYDTPSNYESGKYLRSTEVGIEYVDITGLAEEVAQEIDLPQGVTGFTGLYDTPSNYESGKYLRSTEVGIEYVDITGLAEEVTQEIDLPQGVTGFTGLYDTPTGYQGYSGHYLVVNDGETSLHFTGIEKIAADLTDYGFGGDGGSSNFTGLQDTPNNYSNGSYLKSTTNGLEYAGIVPTSYSDVLSLPSSATQHEGEIVKVGCDIYLSCNGEWQKLDTSSQDNIPSSYPACVTTTEEMIQYDKYEQELSEGLAEQELINSINGIETNTDLHNVCLFQQEEYSSIIFEEGAQWVYRGSIGTTSKTYLQTFATIHPDKNIFASNILGGSSNIKIDTIDPATQTIIKTQTIERTGHGSSNFSSAERGYCITEDFQYLLYLDEPVDDNYIEIKVMKYNTSNGNFELDSTVSENQEAFSTWNKTRLGRVESFSSNYIKRPVIIEGGQKILIPSTKNPINGASQNCIICLQKNGTNWEYTNTFTIGSWESSFHYYVNFSKDGKYFMWKENNTSELQDTIHFLELDYENSTTSVARPSITGEVGYRFQVRGYGGSFSVNNAFDTVFFDVFSGGSVSFAVVYKYDQSTNRWIATNTGNGYYANGTVVGPNIPLLRPDLQDIQSARFSEDGNILAIQIDCGSNGTVGEDCGVFVYYYNPATDQWNLMSGGDYGDIHFSDVSGNLLLSADGKQLVSDSGAVYDINFTAIPRTNTAIYNNSVYIEESTYKWGIFDGSANINLNGDIDPNCTFVEWKSSNATITDSATLNTTAFIDNHTSITGVFNCA